MWKAGDFCVTASHRTTGPNRLFFFPPLRLKDLLIISSKYLSNYNPPGVNKRYLEVSHFGSKYFPKYRTSCWLSLNKSLVRFRPYCRCRRRFSLISGCWSRYCLAFGCSAHFDVWDQQHEEISRLKVNDHLSHYNVLWNDGWQLRSTEQETKKKSLLCISEPM